jgi:adenylylsulfate kinase
LGDDPKPKHVCVDFDGVLAQYTGWQGPGHLGDPRPGVEHFLQSIVDLGMKVIILTTREPVAVQFWLIENQLSHFIDRVTREKPPALVYLDDRALCFRGDFGYALEAIKRFKPYWREG